LQGKNTVTHTSAFQLIAAIDSWKTKELSYCPLLPEVLLEQKPVIGLCLGSPHRQCSHY